MPQSTPPEPSDQADLHAWRPHALGITLSERGLDYTLTCPLADDPSAACHTWREFDEDYLERDGEDGEEPEVREVVHHEEECIAVSWFNWDTRSAVEDGYQGNPRHSLVSGPINVLSVSEDEWTWNYA